MMRRTAFSRARCFHDPLTLECNATHSSCNTTHTCAQRRGPPTHPLTLQDEALDATHPQLEEAEWEEVSRLEHEAQERAAAAAAAASASGRVASVAHAGTGEKAQAATIPQIWNMGEA
jgi:hypothetical protein